MKNKILLLVLLFPAFLMAQEKKSDTLYVKSSVVCGMCKDRIEQAMAFEKGIKEVNVDVEKKTVMLVYSPKKTDPGKIRKTISLIGYDADDVPADQEAHDKLPACCQKGNVIH